jgi:hypothetical protein
MAVIQEYPDELDYVNALLRQAGVQKSFMVGFCNACLRADGFNYEIVRPALHLLMQKCPATAEMIERERRDRGAGA